MNVGLGVKYGPIIGVTDFYLGLAMIIGDMIVNWLLFYDKLNDISNHTILAVT